MSGRVGGARSSREEGQSMRRVAGALFAWAMVAGTLASSIAFGLVGWLTFTGVVAFGLASVFFLASFKVEE